MHEMLCRTKRYIKVDWWKKTMQYKKTVLIVLLLAMLLLAGCNIGSTLRNNPNPEANYYTGNRGVVMQFSDPQSPPARAYYYEGSDFDDNRFGIIVDLHNRGTSYAKGGLYIGGYDPYMFFIEDMQIPRTGGGLWEDCFINIGNFANMNSIGGSIQCNNAGVGANYYGDNNWGFNIRSIGQTFGIDSQVLDQVGVGLQKNGDNWEWNLGLGNLNLAGNSFNNGAAINFMLSLLNFERYNGRGYELRADLPDYPGGEQTIESFEVMIQNWPRGLDQTQPIPFMVTNCYAYSTFVAPQVCIDPSPFDNRRKACRGDGIRFNGGNGAPIAVTQINQENTGRKALFTITIQNVGGGDVYDLFYLERCNPYSPVKLTTRELNKVYLFDARIGDQPLRCTPDRGDGIRLVNGQGQVRCEYDVVYGTAGNAYQTELVLELGYGYAEFIQRQVVVRRV